ncbi:substrate-binding periplasmic protein [Colwellia sp. MEBiC06753]
MRVAIGFLLLFQSLLLNAQILNVGVVEWSGYTNHDGSGVYNELIKKVYSQYEVVLKFDTYQRTINNFRQGKLDFIIGVFREDLEQAYLPRWHLDYEDPVLGFFKPSSHPIKSLKDLNGLTISWMRGYGFDNYLDVPHQAYLVNAHSLGFDMVVKGRTDVFIDYRYNLPKKYQNVLSSFEVLPKRKIYLAFARTDGGKKLAEHYDQHMSSMRKSGQLKALSPQWYQHANFDSFDSSIVEIIIKTRDVNLLRNSSFNRIGTLESDILSPLLGKVKGYDVELAKYTSFAQDDVALSGEENICLANKIKTTARQSKYLFSHAVTMYPGLRLYTKQPLALEQQAPNKLADIFKQWPKLTLGIANGQFFNEAINNELAKLPAHYMVNMGNNTFDQLKGLANDKYSMLIEYPTIVKNHWYLVGDEPLYSYPLNGSYDITLGYLMCNNTPDNKLFLAEFNRQLDLFKTTDYFYSKHRQESNVIAREKFEQLFASAFNLK